jgi:hypothetical protein
MQFCPHPQPAHPKWIKASASIGNGACVELARIGVMIALRDSKEPARPPLFFTRAEVVAFFDGVRDGEFDELLHS